MNDRDRPDRRSDSQHDDALSAHILECWPVPGVRAGSALVSFRDRLLAIQDDSLSVAWIQPHERSVKLEPLEGRGEALAKTLKPDFEAAVLGPEGNCYILGSGSTPQRRRIARIEPSGRTSVAERDELYLAVEKALGTTPNLEGAVPSTSGVRLFHRGAAGAPSIAVEVPWAALDGAEPSIQHVQRYALGQLQGVPLAITDVATDQQGRTYFLAVAEDTPNAIDDGPVVGMVIGCFTGRETQEWRLTPLLEADGTISRRKGEGLAVDPEGQHAWVITDPDDPAQAATLCRVRLDGFPLPSSGER